MNAISWVLFSFNAVRPFGCDQHHYEPVALTVMVTLTGSLSSVGGAWSVGVGLGVALGGGMVSGEAARGIAIAGPGKEGFWTSEKLKDT